MSDSEATPRRLAKALRGGDSPIAPAVGRFVAFGVVLVGSGAAATAVRARFTERLRQGLAAPESVSAVSLTMDVAVVCAPLLAAAAVATVVVGLAQTGGAFASRREVRGRGGLAFLTDGDRWLSAARSVLSFAAVAAIAIATLRGNAADVAGLDEARVALDAASALVLRAGKLSLVVLAVAAVLDVAGKRRSWLARWRFTASERARERRETEAPEAVLKARARLRDEARRE